jgi:ribosomal protein L11 methylase PrmA
VSATPVERLSGRFDAIVANICATVLIELASALQSRLDPDGWLALSGLSPGQVSKVAAAYSRLEITAVRADDDWVALVGRHRAGPSGAGSPPGSTDVTS